MLSYKTTSQAYLDTVWRLLDKPDCVSSPRGMEVSELLDFGFHITEPNSAWIVTRDESRNQAIERYTKREFKLYTERIDHAATFAQGAPFWKQIANPDGTVNSAYGALIWRDQTCGNRKFENVARTPWQWALECLQADPDTRQAFVRFSRPDHQWMGNKDQVCTMHGHFMRRRGKLNFTVVMRSNDVVRGLVYDMPFFVFLLEMMAQELGWEVGTYGHFAHSMHLYSRDAGVARKMLGL